MQVQWVKILVGLHVTWTSDGCMVFSIYVSGVLLSPVPILLGTHNLRKTPWDLSGAW